MAITLRDPSALGALADIVARANSKPKHGATVDALHQRCAELEAENARLASRVTYLEGLNQRDEQDAELRFSRHEERISELRAEVKRLKHQLTNPAPAPSSDAKLTMKEFAKRHHIGERTAYRRRDDGLIVRPDGSPGWATSGGGDIQDHYMIYADAIILPKPPKAKQPKKSV